MRYTEQLYSQSPKRPNELPKYGKGVFATYPGKSTYFSTFQYICQYRFFADACYKSGSILCSSNRAPSVKGSDYSCFLEPVKDKYMCRAQIAAYSRSFEILFLHSGCHCPKKKKNTETSSFSTNVQIGIGASANFFIGCAYLKQTFPDCLFGFDDAL